MGIVGQGGIKHSKSGNYCGKISKVLSLGSNIPFLGKICSIISKIASFYVEIE